MEQVIGTVASGFGNTVSFLADNGILFVVFALIWIGFGVGLIWSQGTLDEAWRWVGSQNIVVQLVLWVLFLPVMAGMWIWHTAWPVIVRLALVASLAGWTLLVFPKPWR